MSDWKKLADWLVKLQVLPSINNDTMEPWSAKDPQISNNLMYIMKDGVLLCFLLNRLKTNVIESKSFSKRPQSSLFLSEKNIKEFLSMCEKSFGLSKRQLFDVDDLLNLKNPSKVLLTLSTLSQIPLSANKYGSFSIKETNAKESLIKNYSSKSDDIYSGNSKYYSYIIIEENEEEIYQSVLGNKVSTVPVQSTNLIEKESVIKEILDTEKFYVKLLNSLIFNFKKPLESVLNEDGIDKIFQNIDSLYLAHESFLEQLEKTRIEGNFFDVADCFINHKEKFLDYGEYCSNIQRAQTFIDDLKNNVKISLEIEKCQEAYNDSNRKLRDLLIIPLQRVLKYPLFLKRCMDCCDEYDIEKKKFQKALDEFEDLAQYVNEVKRDNENLNNIETIEKSINNIKEILPGNTKLKDYGHLIKDGELKDKSSNFSIISKGKLSSNMTVVFLFEKLIIECQKLKDNSFEYCRYIYMEDSHISSTSMPIKGDKSFQIINFIPDQSEPNIFTFKANSKVDRDSWVQAFNKAKDSICPPKCLTESNHFKLNSFKKPTICDVCRKLLKGIFYQGYHCTKSKLNVHKSCIENVGNMTSPLKIIRDSMHLTNLIQREPSKNIRKINSYINSSTWFAGNMEPIQAFSILNECPNGTFLIRKREVVGMQYSLYVKYESNHKIKINYNQGLFSIEPDCNFESMEELIDFYQENSLKPAFDEVNGKLLYPYQDIIEIRKTFEGPVCRCINDYNATHPQQLSLKKGDIIQIINKELESRCYWKGRLKEKIGVFPIINIES